MIITDFFCYKHSYLIAFIFFLFFHNSQMIYLTSAKVGFILFGRMLDIVSKDTRLESDEYAIFTMSTGINGHRMFCNSKRFNLETRF